MNRAREIQAGGAVATAEAAHAGEQEHEPVVLIDELAVLLKTSVRTIRRQLRAKTFFLPEMARIDRRHRWSRRVVLDSIAASRVSQFESLARLVSRRDRNRVS